MFKSYARVVLQDMSENIPTFGLWMDKAGVSNYGQNVKILTFYIVP